MIARHSISGVLRSKGKSFLFFLLIAALTLLVNLGVMVLVSTTDYLDACDEAYTTIGVVEYIGADYPDSLAYDPRLAELLSHYDFSALTSLPGVLHWERSARALGSVAGYQRADPAMPEKMTAVLIIGNISYIDSIGMYSAQIKQSLYSREDKTNTAVFFDPEPYPVDPAKTYIAYGEYYYGKTGYTNFRILPFSAELTADLDGRIRPLTPVSREESGQYQYDPAYDLLAKMLQVSSNSFVVNATSDIFSCLPFQQQRSYMIDGRAFTEDEYFAQSKVCIISELAAIRMGLGVGDSLQLSIADPASRPLYASYWPETGFAESDQYRIVGICNETPDGNHDLFIPQTDQVRFASGHAGFTIGRAVIDNSMADTFYRQAEPLMVDGIVLTLYDQGYAAVTEPFVALQRVTAIVTLVCILASLAVLALFGYLFVYRQRETAAIMNLLGTGQKRVFAYFALGTGLIATAGVLLGGAAAVLSHKSLIRAFTAYAKTMILTDLRFSDGNLSIIKTLEFSPQVAAALPVLIGFCIIGSALISSMAFTTLTIRRQKPGGRKPRTPHHMRLGSTQAANPVKYAALSIVRGGLRSMLLPVVALMVFLMFGQLILTAYNYDTQLREIKAGTIINGRFTDINGKQIGNLVLDAKDLAGLSRLESVSGLYVALDKPYSYLGISQNGNGTKYDVKSLPLPRSQFAFETMQAKFARGPRLVFTNSIDKTPEFYYINDLHMRFLDGYSGLDLARHYDGGAPMCLVSASFLIERRISLGDTIRVSLDDPEPGTGNFRYLDLLVIGSFKKQGSNDNIYCQLGDGFDNVFLKYETFSSAAFTLQNADRLSEFKDNLVSLGFSEVNRIRDIRSFIVIEDKMFNSTISGLLRQIRYTNVFYTIIFALSGLIGLVIAWLVTASRRLELAIMRGLGASSLRTALSFFLEQMILCLIGNGFGAAAWLIFKGPLLPGHLLLAGGFAMCQACGILTAIAMMNRQSALRILTDEDV